MFVSKSHNFTHLSKTPAPKMCKNPGKKRIEKDSHIKQKEYCCLCGAETEYMFDDPIQERENYIVGIGQLCRSCAVREDRNTPYHFIEDY